MPYWRGFSRRIGQKRRGTRFLWRLNDFTELLVTIVRLIKFAGERSPRGTRVSFSFLHGKNKQPFLPPPANYANHRIKGIIVADEHELRSEKVPKNAQLFEQMYHIRFLLGLLGQRVVKPTGRRISMRDMDLINIDGPIWAPDFRFE